jgi:hypothetical protein
MTDAVYLNTQGATLTRYLKALALAKGWHSAQFRMPKAGAWANGGARRACSRC